MNVVATGQKAQDFKDKTTDTLKMIRPFRDGVIKIISILCIYWKMLLKRLESNLALENLEVGVPVKVTEIEWCMAIEEV